MNRWKTTLTLICSLGLTSLAGAQTLPNEITLTLRVWDSRTGQVTTKPLKIDPRKVGIVIVDPWNYHWCMTWTEQAGGMTPRMNRALQGCRKLGMTVMWADRHRQHVLGVGAAAASDGCPLRARAQCPQGRLPLDRALWQLPLWPRYRLPG